MRVVSRLCASVVVAVLAQVLTTARAGEVPAESARTQRAPSLLVLAPKSLAPAVEPLVAHKNATGIPARLVTLESLPRGKCADDAERVKRAIAAAHESHGVRWVLLVGDASLFPVRYRQVRQVPEDAHLDCTYNPTDHYYANLYGDHAPGANAEDPAAITHGGAFDTWDADGDGAYDAQHWAGDAHSWNPDRVDGCPDVAVGRLPAHDAAEVTAYVEKVVRYETTQIGDDTDQRIACVADAGYFGAPAMCDEMLARGLERGFADDVVVERLVLGWGGTEYKPPARWEPATFADVDAAVGRDGWVVYLGHAMPLAWSPRECGRRYDHRRVRELENRDAPAVVITIGCESGRYMAWAPSERYVDASGRTRAFVYDGNAKRWDDAEEGKRVGKRLVVPPPGPYDLPDNRDRTFACSWLFSPGGAVAFAGQSLVCEPDKGRDLVAEVLRAHVGSGRVLGDLWLEGQRRYWLANRTSEDVFRHPRIYLGIMTLFGDPSLRLRKPAER